MTSPSFAVGFLAGRARGVQRGNLSLLHVESAIRLARKAGVDDVTIVNMLYEFSLTWDPATNRVQVAPDVQEAMKDPRGRPRARNTK